jgi:iron-sulfur cluster assembly protein
MSGTVTEADRLVRLTDRALAEVRAIFARESPAPGTGLRLGVVGGGCSGLQYKMEFSERQARDHVESFGDVVVLLDPKSSIYLKGITLDFDDGLMGKGFVFRNPNATNTCGCGESFTV